MTAVERDAFAGVELEVVLIEQLVHIIRVLCHAFHDPCENFIGGREVGAAASADGELVEVRPVVCELVNVGLQEVFAARIEHPHIAVEKLFGHGGVERLLGILQILHELRGPVGDARVVGTGRQDSRRRCRGRSRFWGRATGCDDKAKRDGQREGREVFCFKKAHGNGHNFDPM